MSAGKERPILFSGPMVRALLSGAKTQTRRVVKPQPERIKDWSCPGVDGLRFNHRDGEQIVAETWTGANTHRGFIERCPYGQPGDRLWVRETHAWVDRLFEGYDREDPMVVAYQANKEVREHGAERSVRFDARGLNWDMVRWRPSIHMPRWASRITLEITAVRVERVQDISEENARAEGVGAAPFCKAGRATGQEHVEAFEDLWCDINGAASWVANPWVWVVEFRRVA